MTHIYWQQKVSLGQDSKNYEIPAHSALKPE